MSTHPNLIYIFPDEFRAQAMGFRGEDPVLTPNLDALAQESLVFRNAYSNCPLCSPYRGILFTGRYPFSNGVTGNCHSGHPDCYLREDDRCLPDVLSENGYQCGYIGKWHLETPREEDYPYIDARRQDGLIWDAYTPPGKRRHGFDFWYSYGCCDWHFTPHYWKNEAGIRERIDVKGWSPIHETDVAVDYIQRVDTDRPFALFLAHNPPHMPFEQVPHEYLERYEGKTADELLVRPNAEKIDLATDNVKRYFAAISGLDDQLKRVLDALEERGLRDNTIVVYTSDHGEMMGSHGRMGKACCYDEAFRVPLLIRYPEKLRPRVTDMIFSTVDLMPTLLTLMGLGGAIPEGLHGKNAVGALLENRDEAIRQALYVLGENQRGFADERFTFCMERTEAPEGAGAAGGAGTADVSGGASSQENAFTCLLFDHQADPYQIHNLAPERPELVQECRQRLAGLLEECGDPAAEYFR